MPRDVARNEGIGCIILMLTLLTTFINSSAGPVSAATLDLGVTPKARWTLHQLRGPHCFTVDVPTPGHWWLTLSARQPSTSPAFLVLGEPGTDPRTVARFEAVLLAFEKPGEHVVCSTSNAALGKVEIGLTPKGDPLEVEVDPDPLTRCQDPILKGDPLEVEVDPAPLTRCQDPILKGDPLEAEVDPDP